MTLTNESPSPTAPNIKARRRLSQIGLSTLLLATASAAIWYSWWTTRHQLKIIRDQLAVVRPLMRELVLKDRDHLSVVMRPQTAYDEYSWQVFVPSDGYKLYLVTTGVDLPYGGPDVWPSPEDSVQLRPGIHTIALETYLDNEEWITEVQVDMDIAMRVKHDKDWNEGSGSIGGSSIDEQVNVAPNASGVALFRRVFSVRSTDGTGAMQGNKEGNGIQLWIQRVNANAEAAEK